MWEQPRNIEKRKLTQKMGNIISEDAAKPVQAGAGAADKIRKSARQLAYDVRYKVKQGF